ncbi:KEX1 [Candida theae]|uniref:Carboxypeptidase n=1 Tax=Candida theae TaxID=1198502 RepID=A0AAD5FZ99_9ASCO|nr:KEX1 [Candida theae]KAI5960690.1 KEX1 [Candida theae]
MKFSSILTLSFNALSVFALPHKGSGSNDAKEYLVTSLPGWDKLPSNYSKPIMHAGQLDIFPENNTHYFFWKVADSVKSEENKNRTTFWLNGGPGCSSVDGVLLENGPFRINKEEEIVVNNGSWHKVTDMVYVDQPSRVGFSYGPLISQLDQVQTNFLAFLDKYFELFPEDSSNDIYISGESYGGQYIPYIATAILERTDYKLKGLLIGNGWVSPNEQSLSYIPFFKEHGLIDDHNPSWPSLYAAQAACEAVVNGSAPDGGNENDAPACDSILNTLLQATTQKTPSGDQCLNVYDYKLRDSDCGNSYPQPDESYVTRFLRDPKVIESLNIQHKTQWQECSSLVSRTFTASKSAPAKSLLPALLKQIPIVLYSGALDITCNSQGALGYISNMTWNGAQGFTNPDNHIDWEFGDEQAGWVLQDRNLTFVNVYNASHILPYNVPEISRSLFQFVTGTDQKRDGKIVTTP